MNSEGCREALYRCQLEAVREVLSHRLLSQSDVHNTNDVAAGTAGAIASFEISIDYD